MRTRLDLGRRLSVMGADLLVEALDGLAAGRIVPAAAGQRAGHVRAHAEKGRRPHRLEPFGRPDSQPGARHAALAGRLFELSRRGAARVARAPNRGAAGHPPGALVRIKPLLVACGVGALELIEVQMEGRKRMPAADFANGQRLVENEILGEVPV